MIDNHVYTVQDRFGGNYGTTKIDIFMESKADALRFGRQIKIMEVKSYVKKKQKDWQFRTPDW